jgi:hypothetical protein
MLYEIVGRTKMLYGYTKNNETVVVAADTVFELEGWYQGVMTSAPEGYSEQRATEFMDYLTNPEFKGYKHPAYIFNHSSNDERDAFVLKHDIKILPSLMAKDFMLDMMDKASNEITTGFDLRREGTIGEIAGLNDENDRWDPRSESEKAAAKSQEKRTDELRKRLGDHVTGQSFDPNPRSGAEDGMKISEIFDAGGKINVQARKFGSGAASKAKDVYKAVAKTLGFDPDNVTDEDLARADMQLAEVGYTSEEITKVRDQFDFNEKDHRKAYAELAAEENKRKRVAKALSPVEGSMSKEEILAEVEKRLGEIDSVSSDERDALMEAVREKMDAPRPLPADYKFALNQRLTDSPAMRGAGTPIFTFEKNREGPNEGKFGKSDLPLLLPKDEGFDMVSGDIYEYTGGTAVEGRDWLLARGFIEDMSIIPDLDKPKVRDTSRALPTPEDFAKALAGNGTSTMDGTDSWGRSTVGTVSHPELEDIKPGMVGDKGAVLPISDGLKDITFDELPATIKNAIGKDISDLVDSGKKLKMGDYNGVGFGVGSFFPFPETDEHKIIDDLCGNMRDLGGVSVGAARTRIMTKDNERYRGVVVYTTSDEVWVVVV